MVETPPDAAALRSRLVEILREQGALHDERVTEAFRAVPRELFLPGQSVEDVYVDRAVITHRSGGVPVSSSSQPAIMALMLEMLDVRPGHRVLEVGAGTGYNAALLSTLAGPQGHVVTVDIDPAIAEEARAHLAEAGHGRVEVVAGDGGQGHAPGAPYDRIIATASCWRVPEAWADQLREGGLLVLPFRLNGTQIVLALRRLGATLETVSATPGGFMALRGASGGMHEATLPPDIRLAADVPIDPDLLAALEAAWDEARPAELELPEERERYAFALYLSLQGAPLLDASRWPRDGPPTGAWRLLVTSPASALRWQTLPQDGGTDLLGSDEAAGFVRAALVRWRLEGEPRPEALRMRLAPSDAGRGLGALPRPIAGRYRFGRGAHAIEAWYVSEGDAGG